MILVDLGDAVLGPFSPKAHNYASKVLHEGRGGDAPRNIGEGDRCRPRRPLRRRHDPDALRDLGRRDQGGCAGGRVRSASRGAVGGSTCEADLTVADHPNVYVVGDIANIPEPKGSAFPQLGSVALQAGEWAAENILADIDGEPRTPFAYHDKGIMAMIGRNAADRRDGRAPPRAARRRGVRRLARRARLADERRRGSAWTRSSAGRWDYFGRTRAGGAGHAPTPHRIDWGDDDG